VNVPLQCGNNTILIGKLTGPCECALTCANNNVLIIKLTVLCEGALTVSTSLFWVFRCIVQAEFGKCSLISRGVGIDMRQACNSFPT